MELEQWKTEIIKRALAEGLIHDPGWLEKKDEPMPVWAVLEVALLLLEKLDPPCATYD
ncbi:hypothetical protein [Paenibacillus mesotrionivorans]|jgi:hypothetical protein|uniref:Uncharacterized protein n=1 Tax=Paenibacillus mesotrionivorans TaxID=3160968 RepID=A0ACC7NQU1_9BACL